MFRGIVERVTKELTACVHWHSDFSTSMKKASRRSSGQQVGYRGVPTVTSRTKADHGVCAHDNGTAWDVSEAKVLLWFFMLEGTLRMGFGNWRFLSQCGRRGVDIVCLSQFYGSQCDSFGDCAVDLPISWTKARLWQSAGWSADCLVKTVTVSWTMFVMTVDLFLFHRRDRKVC